VRSRELWLWLGGALLTIGTVLSAIALAYFTRSMHFSLYTSWQATAAVTIFGSAFVAFLGGILGWPFRLRQPRFPNLDITIGIMAMTMINKTTNFAGHTVTEGVLPRAYELTITNNETERPVSIGLDFRVKTKSGDPDEWIIFPEPLVPQGLAGGRIAPLIELPVDLQPQSSRKGWIYIELNQHMAAVLSESVSGRMRFIDRNGPWRAYIPLSAGHFTRRQMETVRAAKSPSGNLDPPSTRGWHGVFGPPDPVGQG
jgi:hypothetical protein